MSNKYRNAYERAASALGSMTEMDVARGEKQQANELFHKYYSQLYNRFPAFKREARKVVEDIPLFAGIEF